MKRAALVWGCLSVAILAVGGCSSDGSDGASPSTTDAPAAETTTTLAPAEPLDDQTAPPSINGIVVQGDTIWVASIAGDQVLQVRIEDGAILQRFATDGATPDDVAVAPDGSIWVTGFGNGDLGHITDAGYEVFTTLDSGINPIVVDDAGVLSIGTYGPDGDLYRIDPEDAEPGDAFSPVADGTMPDINAFGILPDGRLLTPTGGLTGPSSAIAIDPESGEFDTIVDDLPLVAAATVDADGNGFVLANLTGEVLRIDVEAGTSEVVRTVTEGSPFDNLSFADDGTLYLSSFATPTITEVLPDGTTRVITIGS